MSRSRVSPAHVLAKRTELTRLWPVLFLISIERGGSRRVYDRGPLLSDVRQLGSTEATSAQSASVSSDRRARFDYRAPDPHSGARGSAGPRIPDRSLPQGEKTDESQGLNRASDPMCANGPKNAHRRSLRPVRRHPTSPASGRSGTLREQPTAAVGRPWEPGRWATSRGSLRPDRRVRIPEMEPPRWRTATRDGASRGGPNRGARGIECRRSHDTRGRVSHGSRRTGCRGDLHRGPPTPPGAGARGLPGPGLRRRLRPAPPRRGTAGGPRGRTTSPARPARHGEDDATAGESPTPPR